MQDLLIMYRREGALVYPQIEEDLLIMYRERGGIGVSSNRGSQSSPVGGMCKIQDAPPS